MALVLKENGFNAKILVEDKTYTGVESWLGDKYLSIDVVAIKEDKVQIQIDDTIVVPEHYSNILPQIFQFKCSKIMLLQQKEYMFETLELGSRWSDFGFDKCITTTESTKKYVLTYFPETLVHVIPPFIDEEVFVPSTRPIKPYIAISCRDRVQHKKIMSEFYLKFPQFRWITFRDMIQMKYSDFGEKLSECMASVWVDDESTFGTFPLESMRCGVPVIGKVPFTEPEWIGENGMWTYQGETIVESLGTFISAWVEGVELPEEYKEKMKETVAPYSKVKHYDSTLNVFNSNMTKRIEILQKALEKIKKEED
jgi:glycosyltransferase involved in cell wall biosynthesis